MRSIEGRKERCAKAEINRKSAKGGVASSMSLCCRQWWHVKNNIKKQKSVQWTITFRLQAQKFRKNVKWRRTKLEIGKGNRRIHHFTAALHFVWILHSFNVYIESFPVYRVWGTSWFRKIWFMLYHLHHPSPFHIQCSYLSFNSIF